MEDRKGGWLSSGGNSLVAAAAAKEQRWQWLGSGGDSWVAVVAQCMQEAAATESHGKTWQRRSRRRLDNGRDVGLHWTKHEDECCKGGCGDGGSQ